MKIAFVVHTAYPEFIGGREHHVHNLASSLSGTDEIVVFAGSAKNHIERHKIDGYTLVQVPTIPIKISQNPLQIYRLIPSLYPLLRKEKFDLIHAFEYGSFSTDIAYLFSKNSDTPFVLTFYGYKIKNFFPKFIKKFYDLFIGSLLFRDIDRIFCPSHSQRQEILEIARNKNIVGKIIIQANCIPIADYEQIAIPEEFIKKYNFGSGIKLITICRILPRKGIKYLIFALERVVKVLKLENINLIILGPDCGELKNIKSLIIKLGLERNVTTVGPIPLQNIKYFLGISDIFVLPSLYEGLPLALLEAMAAGKAVIFTKLSCSEGFIADGEDGLLVKPEDSESLAEAIFKLATDNRLREIMGKNARNKVKRLDSCIETERLRKIYEEILRDRRKPHSIKCV